MSCCTSSSFQWLRGGLSSPSSAEWDPTLLALSSRIWLRCCSVQVMLLLLFQLQPQRLKVLLFLPLLLLLLLLRSGATLLAKHWSLTAAPAKHPYYHLCSYSCYLTVLLLNVILGFNRWRHVPGECVCFCRRSSHDGFVIRDAPQSTAVQADEAPRNKISFTTPTTTLTMQLKCRQRGNQLVWMFPRHFFFLFLVCHLFYYLTLP